MSEEDKKQDNVFPMEDFVKPTKPSDQLALKGGTVGLTVTTPRGEVVHKSEPKP